jgi:hypothetical protein
MTTRKQASENVHFILISQDYHRVVYHDGALVTRFHLETNKDPAASASPWIDGKRTVTFRMPLNVPAMLKKLIGK